MFLLHPQLEKDSLPLGHFELCAVRLMNNRLYPWIILVPQLPGLRELHELPESQQQLMTKEISNASWVVQTLFKADKMNVAMLGNQVAQLHVHIIARYINDAAWPNPVWGAQPAQPYNEEEKNLLISRYREALKLSR